MNIERFSQLIAAYGGDPKRFPEVERMAALELLQQSAPARALQQEALQLDNLLNSLPILQPSFDLEQRILKNMLNGVVRQQVIENTNDFWKDCWEWLFGTSTQQRVWRLAAIVGLPLLLGIGLGVNMPTNQQQSQLAEDTTWVQDSNLLPSGMTGFSRLFL